ncbi:DinB/UmuC family translesion DNA polymerase [Gemmobacter denitrificans]|uniref:DNA polymerase Y-family little finger domain-containing protein n=1 Tax=Gemmobacter denitrificans TaxID=3123040 RepID=A0ABU8BUT1_9RHOB
MRERLLRAGVRDVTALCQLARAIWRSVEGERFVRALQCMDIPLVQTKRGGYGNSKVLAPAFRRPTEAYLVSRWLIEKSSARLRRDDRVAANFSLFISPIGCRSWGRSVKCTPSQDTATFLRINRALWREAWPSDAGAPVRRSLCADRHPARWLWPLGLHQRSAPAGGCACGRTQTDLFQDRQVLLDPDILDACFAEKLERDRLAKLAEGWKAVVAFTESYPNHNAIDDAGRPIKRETIELPEADQQDLDRLRALDELTDEEQERLDDLEARRIGDYTDEDRAQATAFIYVDREGALIFYDARAPREKPQGGDDTGSTVANAETIPSSLREDLRTIATLALQTALLDKPELVLDLLAMCFDPDLPAWGRPLALDPAYQNITPQKPDETRIDARLQSVEGTGRGELTIDLLTDLQAGSKKDRNARITAALTRTFTVANSDFGRALANMLQVNPRKVWNPSAENYFKRLPTGHLDGIWQDLCPMEAADRNRFAGLKKGEKAKLLEQLFHDTDYRERLGLSREENARIDAWLPPELAQGKGASA